MLTGSSLAISLEWNALGLTQGTAGPLVLGWGHGKPAGPGKKSHVRYKAPRVHDAAGRGGGRVAARGARAAAGDAGARLLAWRIAGRTCARHCSFPPRPR